MKKYYEYMKTVWGNKTIFALIILSSATLLGVISAFTGKYYTLGFSVGVILFFCSLVVCDYHETLDNSKIAKKVRTISSL